jgi:hypothetical protein
MTLAHSPARRSHFATVGSILIVMAACGRAPPSDSIDSAVVLMPSLAQLQTAYVDRDARLFTAHGRLLLAEMHTLESAQCASRQAALIAHGRDRGFDGLESLWLMYQDCASGSSQPEVIAMLRANHQALANALRFTREPVRSLPQRYSGHDSIIERGLRTDAIRAVMRAFSAQPTGVVSTKSARAIAGIETVRAALCGLPAIPDQTGQASIPDLFRRAMCLAGRPFETLGAIAETCEDVAAATSGAQSSSVQVMGSQDLDRLRTTCESRVTGGTIGSSGIDGFDLVAEDVCVGASKREVERSERVGELIMACYGDGTSGNPLAANDSTADAGTRTGLWVIRDLQPGKTLLWLRNEQGDHFLLWVDSNPSAEKAGMNKLITDGCTPTEKCDDLSDDSDDEGPPMDGGDEEPDEEESSADTPKAQEIRFDAQNPACRELSSLANPQDPHNSIFWSDVFGRDRPVDPRTVYPTPDAQTDSEIPFCGTLGLAPAPEAAGVCPPVLCTGIGAIDGTCSCARVRAAPATRGACFDVRCSEGLATPVGVGICTCVRDADSEPTEGPPPAPLSSPLVEVLWTRR